MPNFFSYFRSTKELSLGNNYFTGNFPSSIINLTQLKGLDLSNNSLTGSIPSNISGYQDLVLLFLGTNLLTSTIPSWVFSLPSLIYLDLEYNQLTGQLYDFQYQSLQRIYLSGNKLDGPLPKSISKLVNLTLLDLSSNNFSSVVEASLFSNCNQLQMLDLSSNNLFLATDGVNSSNLPKSLAYLYLSSCGIKDLDFLLPTNNLYRLDLSKNMLRGQIFLDQKWYNWSEGLYHLNLSHNFLTNMHQLPFQSLSLLDLSSNLLHGPMFVPPLTISFFITSDNNLSGEIPSSICKLGSLVVLDLSKNNLSGVIPQCLGNASVGLLVELEVLDIGDNNLNGTFPWWLGNLPKLQVLSLRTNNLQGPLTLTTNKTQPSFSALKIIDLSHNEFTGVLPARFFRKLVSKKEINGSRTPLNYIGDQEYQDTTVVPQPPPPPELDQEENDEFFNGFIWKVVLIEYGWGMVIGMIMGCLIFLTGKPKWFNRIVHEEGNKLVGKKRPKYVKWL
ncbi:hypothetical protein ACH5RR_019358 [Cinchona calisaya]|uniref:Uncharacterized protein n=1 Tax=Cinchona calisaya TaxID=153742 RepID=A0ABD2ZQ24_9GENT